MFDAHSYIYEAIFNGYTYYDKASDSNAIYVFYNFSVINFI